MNNLKEIYRKLLDNSLKIEERLGYPRIDGKSELAEFLSTNTKELMIDFHNWIDLNYYKNEHFSGNGFYFPRNGEFENLTIDELFEIYINK